jgi:hypothetical protein
MMFRRKPTTALDWEMLQDRYFSTLTNQQREEYARLPPAQQKAILRDLVMERARLVNPRFNKPSGHRSLWRRIAKKLTGGRGGS